MDQLRTSYTQGLLDASRSVRLEPQPEPSAVWDYIFADHDLVGWQG
jgi:hypothetical protein